MIENIFSAMKSFTFCRRCITLLASRESTISSTSSKGPSLSTLTCLSSRVLEGQGVQMCDKKTIGYLSTSFKLSKTIRPFSSQSEKSQSQGRLNIPWWQRLLVVSAFGASTYYVLRRVDQQKEIESEKVRYKEFDKAQLGGDWVLTDHHGNKRSSTTFQGQWMLMYFGFTHCPDICPEELEKLTKLVKSIDDDPRLPNMQPIFITLDPERDSPAVIKEYLQEFKNPRLIGFTGTEDEIRQVGKKFRVYFGFGPKDEDNDYIVDHTIIIYLVNPDGNFVNYFGRAMTAEQIKTTITQHVFKYNELKKNGL